MYGEGGRLQEIVVQQCDLLNLEKSLKMLGKSLIQSKSCHRLNYKNVD